MFVLVPGLLATVGVTGEPGVAARTARQGSGSDASALSASAVPDDRTPAVAARRRGIKRLSEHARAVPKPIIHHVHAALAGRILGAAIRQTDQCWECWTPCCPSLLTTGGSPR